MSRLILSLSLLCLACSGVHTSQSKPEVIYDVGVSDLLKDHQSASVYVNHKIRFQVNSAGCKVVGNEVHIWAMNPEFPPAIIVKGTVFSSKKNLTVVGKVTSVVRDGRWRSPRCDFYIVIEDAVIMDRASP